MTDLAAAAAANNVVTGALGFLIVAAMGLALFFLLRSMNKQLRKVVGGPKWREDAQDPQPGPRPPGRSRHQDQAVGEQDQSRPW